MDADTVILSGLNEKIWPQTQTPDPWLSLSMQRSLGFSDPEQNTGRAAYTFILPFCAPHVILTWSKKREGSLTLPSRWLQQLFAVLEKNNITWKDYQHPALVWAKNIDRPQRIVPRNAPAPCPPIALRPTSLSATDIREWFNDPYNLYARKILDLKQPDPIDHTAGAREWGIIIHAILEEFLPYVAEADARERFDRIADKILETQTIEPLQRLRWQLRLGRIAQEVIALYDNDTAARYQEVTGRITRQAPHTKITIHGRADLISVSGSSITVCDFKTGNVPGQTEIADGRDPQLAILGLIAQENGFKEFSNKSISGLGYIGVKGKYNVVLQHKHFEKPEELIEKNNLRLTEYISQYYTASTPYSAQSYSLHRYDPYEHLKRTAEWSIPQAENEDA